MCEFTPTVTIKLADYERMKNELNRFSELKGCFEYVDGERIMDAELHISESKIRQHFLRPLKRLKIVE